MVQSSTNTELEKPILLYMPKHDLYPFSCDTTIKLPFSHRLSAKTDANNTVTARTNTMKFKTTTTTKTLHYVCYKRNVHPAAAAATTTTT